MIEVDSHKHLGVFLLGIRISIMSRKTPGLE